MSAGGAATGTYDLSITATAFDEIVTSGQGQAGIIVSNDVDTGDFGDATIVVGAGGDNEIRTTGRSGDGVRAVTSGDTTNNTTASITINGGDILVNADGSSAALAISDTVNSSALITVTGGTMVSNGSTVVDTVMGSPTEGDTIVASGVHARTSDNTGVGSVSRIDIDGGSITTTGTDATTVFSQAGGLGSSFIEISGGDINANGAVSAAVRADVSALSSGDSRIDLLSGGSAITIDALDGPAITAIQRGFGDSLINIGAGVQSRAQHHDRDVDGTQQIELAERELFSLAERGSTGRGWRRPWRWRRSIW